MKLVPVSCLKPGMVLALDILDRNSSFLCLLHEGYILNKSTIQRLESLGLPSVYIKNGIADDVRPLPSPITLEHKIEAMDELENVFSLAQRESLSVTGEELHTLQDTISNIINDMSSGRQTNINIADLKSYDEYTYHHSLSVSVLSIAIGISLGLSKKNLNKLGFCSILHDIGKVLVPVELINKPARLTREEFFTVQQHAILGAKYLQEHDLCNEEICDIVVGHHEKYDGSGYPRGLSGEEILPFSRIISIADVYDALTSKRPYRDPMQPADAMEYIMGRCGTEFDYDLVKAFVNKVDVYPVGSYVRLSDGRLCVVLDNSNSMRPIVRPLDKPSQILDLYNDRQLLSTVITEAFTPGGEKDFLL